MMYVKISLVYLTYLAVQCRSQEESDRHYTALVPSPERQVLYTPYPAGTQERPERQSPYRAEDRITVPLYEYQQDPSYPERQSQESQYQPTYQQYSQVPRLNQIRQSTKPQQQQPAIEQYLKEVTPTTKTAYQPVVYQRPQTQQVDNQSPFQFLLQTKSPQQTYEITIPKKAYQTALSPKPNNGLFEPQRTIDFYPQYEAPSKSAAYASQRVPVNKVPAPPKATSLEAELEYYTKLQEYQQQVQQPKQAAPVKYQVRIPQYTKPEAQGEEQIVYVPYQPRFVPQKGRIPVTEPKHNAEQPQYQQQISYQPLEEEYQNINPQQLYEYQSVPVKDYQVKDLVQYQPVQTTPKYKGGPKYLPDPKYQEVQYQHSDLENFRAQLAKIEQQQAKARPVAHPVALVPAKPQYVQEEPRYQPEPVAHPQPVAPPQPQPKAPAAQNSQFDENQFSQQSREEYEKLKKQLEEDPDPKTQFVKTLGNNSSLRLYKGRPVVFVGQGA